MSEIVILVGKRVVVYASIANLLNLIQNHPIKC